MPPARRSTRAAPISAARESTQPYSRTNTRRSGSPSSNPTPSATLSPGGKNSLKLTVKAAPSKLRQAISGSQLPPNPYTDEASESDATPKPSVRTARATRNPRTVVEQDSDEDDEDEDEDAEGEDDDDEDAEGEEVDQELLANEDSQDDAEGEDDDMEDLPPPPVIKQQKVPGKAKATVSVSAPPAGPLKSVEAKEMEDADDDEELSDLESGDEMELGEGEEEVDIGEEDDDLSGSDIDGSRSATPDPSKLTRRQRGVFEEENVGLLALSNEAQKKKLLSVEEHAMRRQEMARRRKNLSEKRNEEEKVRSTYRLTQTAAMY
jgi:Ino eighty subunit 2